MTGPKPEASPSGGPGVTPVPSATVLLLRDGAAGLEVLMTVRHQAAGFAAGAYVFPGGKVDPGDRDYAARHGGGDAAESLLTHRLAAVRETFEECGVLLARRAGEEALVGYQTAFELCDRWRGAPGGFTTLLEGEGLEPAVDLLVPFAHWITPRDRPKRFNTHFFLAPAPVDQAVRHDGWEAVEAEWMTPQAVLDGAEQGAISLVFATKANLQKLGRSRSVAEAVAAAGQSRIVTVQPELVHTDGGPILRIPEDAGYGPAETPLGRLLRP